MGRISVVLLVGGVLLASVDSYLHGFRFTSSARNFIALKSDASTNNFVGENILISSEVSTDNVEASSSPIMIESATETTATILTNPLAIESISNAADASSTDADVVTASITLSEIGVVNGTADASVAVVTKVLKLASLGPAYPDNTSYMMCGACKAGYKT